MPESFISQLVARPYLASASLFLLLLGSVHLGRMFGRRAAARDSDLPGTGAINGAIFALLGLILAFSFSGAASRFELRRDLIVKEANAIGTAALRIDLVPIDAQPALRDAFGKYVESRIATYQAVDDTARFQAGLKQSTALQKQIWNLSVAAGKRPNAAPTVNTVLLPALNEMIDITATRALAMMMHPPSIVHYMLIGLAVMSGFLAGIGLAPGTGRSWVHPISFALIMTAAIYVTIDMEYPRAGFIRVDNFENAVVAFNLGD